MDYKTDIQKIKTRTEICFRDYNYKGARIATLVTTVFKLPTADNT
jgi:hypothetical protein